MLLACHVLLTLLPQACCTLLLLRCVSKGDVLVMPLVTRLAARYALDEVRWSPPRTALNVSYTTLTLTGGGVPSCFER